MLDPLLSSTACCCYRCCLGVVRLFDGYRCCVGVVWCALSLPRHYFNALLYARRMAGDESTKDLWYASILHNMALCL
jgi:hypothetical protein